MQLDESWGLDMNLSVLKHAYPDANIPLSS